MIRRRKGHWLDHENHRKRWLFIQHLRQKRGDTLARLFDAICRKWPDDSEIWNKNFVEEAACSAWVSQFSSFSCFYFCFSFAYIYIYIYILKISVFYRTVPCAGVNVVTASTVQRSSSGLHFRFANSRNVQSKSINKSRIWNDNFIERTAGSVLTGVLIEFKCFPERFCGVK